MRNYNNNNKIEKIRGGIVLAVFTVLFMISTQAQAYVTITENPLGGTTETEFNNAGEMVRETDIDENGNMTRNMERNPETGESTRTSYDGESRRIQSREIRDANGNVTVELYDLKGNLQDVEVTDKDNKFVSRKRFRRDEDGNIVNEVHYDEDERITDSIDTKYDKKTGRLISRKHHQYIHKRGKKVKKKYIGSTHTYKESGEEWLIRHNPDGSTDVWIYGPNGLVSPKQHSLSSHSCIKRDCDYMKAKREKEEAERKRKEAEKAKEIQKAGAFFDSLPREVGGQRPPVSARDIQVFINQQPVAHEVI